jgi:PAS domain S-box-containing protein
VEALLDNNQILKLAEFTIKHSGDSIIFHDCHGKILKANQSACKLLNYSSDELVGLSIQDINPDSNKNKWKQFWKELKTSKTISFEARHQTKNGLIIPTEVTVNFIEFDNQEYAVGFVRDITCRKKIEEERATAYEEICKLRGKLELEKDYLYEEVKELQSFGNIIGKSYSLQTILKQIEMVAPTDANVLITGESGTGKELFAHEIHQRSPRSSQPMIRVNCASIPRELYESEFFGHVKGAFTGAIRDRVGRFQLADGGTLFLDEVGEIPLDLQSKLLRVLQEGTFERIGDEKTFSSDVRIIAATNQNLKKDVSKGTFREDLYYRLNVFPIEAIPLRERKEDISLLAYYFLNIAQEKFNRTGIKLSKANLISMENYDWPGNIRELQNIIERAVIISQSGRLIIDLPKVTPNRNISPSKQYINPGEKVLTFDEIKLFERGNILKALDQSKWKIFGPDGAAALLNIPPTTLTTRIKRLGLIKPVNP